MRTALKRKIWWCFARKACRCCREACGLRARDRGEDKEGRACIWRMGHLPIWHGGEIEGFMGDSKKKYLWSWICMKGSFPWLLVVESDVGHTSAYFFLLPFVSAGDRWWVVLLLSSVRFIGLLSTIEGE